MKFSAGNGTLEEAILVEDLEDLEAVDSAAAVGADLVASAEVVLVVEVPEAVGKN